MVAEQRGYTPWMGEEPKDGVGLVKTIPRKRPQRRRVEMSGELLVGSAASLEHPPLGGSGWDGTETDVKENVLELEADDLDEKIINDGVKVKRFKVRAWSGVHMSQSGQENPGAQCGDKDSDIGRIDDEERVVKDWRHTHREATSSKEEKQVWMQFKGRTRPWDVRCDEGGDEIERRWREKNRMEGVEMHMVSRGRLLDWNGIKDLAKGAMVQVMVNVQGGMGKRGKKKKREGNPWESDGGSGVRSSAEEPFEILDKAALMVEHRKVMGNRYVDMLVDMEMEDVKAKLEELREMTEGTEDQKTLAVLSLMWMVERRKEER